MTTIIMRLRRSAPGVLSVLVAMLALSCSTVPLSGRKQLSLVPSSQMLSMSFQQYGDFMKQNKGSTNQAQVQRVNNVGTRSKGAVEHYMAQNGLSGR